jgi:hypothetical protein
VKSFSRSSAANVTASLRVTFEKSPSAHSSATDTDPVLVLGRYSRANTS